MYIYEKINAKTGKTLACIVTNKYTEADFLIKKCTVIFYGNRVHIQEFI